MSISNGAMKTHGYLKRAIQKTVPVRRKKGKKVETVNEQQVQQEVSPTSRPYSLTGFCIYVGASSKWWSTFRTEL